MALAYVLAQPFPVVPLIGPRTLQELDDSLEALDIKLTPEQVRWLEGPRREDRSRIARPADPHRQVCCRLTCQQESVRASSSPESNR